MVNLEKTLCGTAFVCPEETVWNAIQGFVMGTHDLARSKITTMYDCGVLSLIVSKLRNKHPIRVLTPQICSIISS